MSPLISSGVFTSTAFGLRSLLFLGLCVPYEELRKSITPAPLRAFPRTGGGAPRSLPPALPTGSAAKEFVLPIGFRYFAEYPGITRAPPATITASHPVSRFSPSPWLPQRGRSPLAMTGMLHSLFDRPDDVLVRLSPVPLAPRPAVDAHCIGTCIGDSRGYLAGVHACVYRQPDRIFTVTGTLAWATRVATSFARSRAL